MKLQSRAVLMFAVLVAILFADVFASATEVTAQAQVPERRTVDEIQTDLDRALSRDKELEQIIQLLNENADIAASPVSKKYNETLISQYEYIIALMKYNEQMLAWELFASSVSLWLVVAIVAAGVGFSGFQLWQAAKTGKPQSTSRLEISAKSFRLTSSIVGVIVLGLSYIFFYLFVKEIYAVRPVPEVAAQEKR